MEKEELALTFHLASKMFRNTETYKSLYGVPNPMSKHKKEHAIRNRKKSRGVKHGKRNK